MSARPVIAALVVLLAVLTGSASAPQPAQPDLERRFTTIVRPFLDSYCTSCHGGATPAAQLDLRAYASADAVARDHERWALVVEKMAAQQMPPSQAKQPDAESRRQVIEWIGALRRDQARKHAGDPGVVLARRLSNAEYNYTIRDLTGVDMRPAREFPVDPANPAGFDNSGESLAMSPALMTKYFQAAREVSNHLVLKPDGLAFAPHPMLVETDRDKYAVNQIIDFYHRQVRDRRQDDFVDSLSRKLLAYALGRSLILPDDVTVDLMREKLAATGYRFDTLIETIVTSPQFLTKR